MDFSQSIMIMSLFKVIAMTNRELSVRPLEKQVLYLIDQGIKTFILREKDLPLDEYILLAKKIYHICQESNCELILHNFIEAGYELNCKSIHVPLNVLNEMSQKDLDFYNNIGCSCHSVKEGILAKKMGATYISISNIFETKCKEGLKGKGVDIIQDCKKALDIPVYSLGGINESNICLVKKAGCDGAILMRDMMVK